MFVFHSATQQAASGETIWPAYRKSNFVSKQLSHFATKFSSTRKTHITAQSRSDVTAQLPAKQTAEFTPDNTNISTFIPTISAAVNAAFFEALASSIRSAQSRPIKTAHIKALEATNFTSKCATIMPTQQPTIRSAVFQANISAIGTAINSPQFATKRAAIIEAKHPAVKCTEHPAQHSA